MGGWGSSKRQGEPESAWERLGTPGHERLGTPGHERLGTFGSVWARFGSAWGRLVMPECTWERFEGPGSVWERLGALGSGLPAPPWEAQIAFGDEEAIANDTCQGTRNAPHRCESAFCGGPVPRATTRHHRPPPHLPPPTPTNILPPPQPPVTTQHPTTHPTHLGPPPRPGSGARETAFRVIGVRGWCLLVGFLNDCCSRLPPRGQLCVRLFLAVPAHGQLVRRLLKGPSRAPLKSPSPK